MGVRLKKKIGWGLELDASQINEERFASLESGEAWLDFDEFNEFIHDLDFPLKPLVARAIVLNSERIKHGLEPIKRPGNFDIDWSLNFLSCLYGEYDYFPESSEDNRRFILTPYSATHDVLSANPTKSNTGDEVFAYAEFEILFPQEEHYTNQSFTFKSPPFPDSYEVIGAQPVTSVKDLVFPPIGQDSLSSLSFIRPFLMSRLLEGKPGNEEFENLAHAELWKLSAPVINMALVELSGVLKDNTKIFDMQPRVIYEWA